MSCTSETKQTQILSNIDNKEETVIMKKNNPHLPFVVLGATKKKPYYFPLYWLVNRDPYIGLL